MNVKLKHLIIFLFFIFSVFPFPVIFAQSTGFILVDSAKIYYTNCSFSDTAMSGKSYRFEMFGIGPDSLSSLSSYVIWAKVYNKINIPSKIIIDFMTPSYINGILRVAIGLDTLDSGPLQSVAASGFVYLYPGSGWTTKTFNISSIPGASKFKRLGLALSLIQGETGRRVVFIDNIRYISSTTGDTTMLDDGSVPPVPPAPNLISPPNGANGIAVPPTFVFSSVSSVDKYWVQVTKVTGEIVWSDSNITSTTVTGPLNAFAPGNFYYWRVKAKYNVGGWSDWSPWSPTWSFQTSELGRPVLIWPFNNSTGLPLVLNLAWEAVNGATSYTVQVSENSSFSPSSLVGEYITAVNNKIVTLPKYAFTYYWRVKVNNGSLSGPWSEIWNFMTIGTTNVNVNDEIPDKFVLKQNYPNPFNPSTTISFSIPTSEFVTLKVYDVLGREVATLVNENLTAGSYSYYFDAKNLPSGVYLYKLQAGKYSDIKNMILIK